MQGCYGYCGRGPNSPAPAPYSTRLAAGTYTRIWPLGDSITYGHGGTPNNEGYRRRLDEWATAQGWGAAWDFVGNSPAGSGFDSDQNGHPAYTLAQLDTVVTTQYVSTNVRADLVMFLGGTNDCAVSYDGTTTPAAYAALLTKIQNVNKLANIVVMTLPPHQSVPANVADFNSKLPAIWDAHDAVNTSKLIRVDINAALGTTWSSTYFSDAAHPNNTGYDAMALAIETALTTQAVWVPAI